MNKNAVNFNLLKGNKRAIIGLGLFATASFFPDFTLTQNGRYKQLVDVSQEANKPFYQMNNYLSYWANQGIISGTLKPVLIDYEQNLKKDLTLAEYTERLTYVPIAVDTIAYSETDTAATSVQEQISNTQNNPTAATQLVLLEPFELTLIELDVTKLNGKVKNINYVSFYGPTPDGEGMKYIYSLPFPEFAAYLDHLKSLYVKNTNKLVWINDVVNTNGWYADNIVADLFGVNDGGLIRIIEKKSGEKKAVEVYSYDYKKLKKVDFDEITPKSEGAEIKLLSKALEDGNYVVAQEFEVKTTLPENTDIVELAKTPVTFKLFQRDLVELDNAKNKKYFRQGQEFTTFLLNAYEKGLIKNAYTSDSLTTVLSQTDWEKRMEMQNFLIDESEKATQPKVYYTGQQANTVELNWEVVFNKNGEIIS